MWGEQQCEQGSDQDEQVERQVARVDSDRRPRVGPGCTGAWGEIVGEAAQKLVATLPNLQDHGINDEWVVHFVNSGSEAVDLATLMARSYTGCKDMLGKQHLLSF